MKNLISILSLFVFSSGFACDVTLPEQMILLNIEKISKESINHSSCDDAAIEETISTLSGLDGNIANFQLKEMLANKGHSINFHPTRVKIKQLKNIIHDQLDLPQDHHVKTIHKFTDDSFLSLSSTEKVEISCIKCPTNINEQQQYNMKITLHDGSLKNHIIFAEFKKYIKGYRLNSSVSAFSEIRNLGSLEEVSVEEIPHTELISDLNTLRFFKTNKALKKGDLLKRSDFNKVDLVKAGFKTEVLLENDVLKIKTHGISNSSGGIGSWVEVYNAQKNKKYLGKVIDNNKVLVEL